MPPDVAIVDLFVDIHERDVWAAAGIRAITANGASLVYFDSDLNTPGHQTGLVNPGPANRYVTCLSRPRSRNGDARFTNGAAYAVGGFLPPGTALTTEPTALNVSYLTTPPPTPQSPTVDGYVARLALDLSATEFSADELIVTFERPAFYLLECAPPPTALGYYGFLNATAFDQFYYGEDFWVTVPEPAGIALLVCSAAQLRKRRA